MPIPDYQSVMLPLLKLAADQQEHSLPEAIDTLSLEFALTEGEREEILPSGKQAVFDNRVGWARTYLKKAGLVESPRRSFFKITSRGLEVIQQNLKTIDVRFLRQYPEFIEFRLDNRRASCKVVDLQAVEIPTNNQKTPREYLEDAYLEIKQDLAQDIILRIKACSPRFFERLVVQLLVKMGYGGSIKDAGQAVGRSGDGGIDGIIKEDKLGLDVIYIQAKRWESTVGRPEIQRFVGALHGLRARKGIFITTSVFSVEAVDYVSRIENKIVLVNGIEMAQLMIDHDVGVSLVEVYEIKKVDEDFFTDE